MTVEQIILQLIQTFGTPILAALLVWVRLRAKIKEQEEARIAQGVTHDAQIETMRLSMEQQRDATSGQLMRQMMDLFTQFPKAIKDNSLVLEDLSLMIRTWMKQDQTRNEELTKTINDSGKSILSRVEHYGSDLSKRLDVVPSIVWSQAAASQMVEAALSTEAHLKEVKNKLVSIDNGYEYVDKTLTSVVDAVSRLEKQGATIMQIIQQQQETIDKLKTERDQLRADNERLAQDNQLLRDQLKASQANQINSKPMTVVMPDTSVTPEAKP